MLRENLLLGGSAGQGHINNPSRLCLQILMCKPPRLTSVNSTLHSTHSTPHCRWLPRIVSCSEGPQVAARGYFASPSRAQPDARMGHPGALDRDLSRSTGGLPGTLCGERSGFGAYRVGGYCGSMATRFREQYAQGLRIMTPSFGSQSKLLFTSVLVINFWGRIRFSIPYEK